MRRLKPLHPLEVLLMGLAAAIVTVLIAVGAAWIERQ